MHSLKRDKGYKIFSNIFLLLLVAVMVLPFVLLFMSSITEEGTLVRNGYSLFPEKFSLEAYRYISTNGEKIFKAYGVTVFVTAVGTAMNVLLTSMLAYPLSQKKIPGRSFFTFYVFFTMLFNGGLVPSYIMWTQTFHIKNTLAALLFPSLMMNAFYVIMMRTYFTTNIPDAVIEAARIDGAGELRILSQVVMPMSIPIIATLALLAGLAYWNDWLNGLYYISDDRLFSIQVLLNRMLLDVQFLMSNSDAAKSLQQNEEFVLPSTGIRMAVAVMGALPILVVYPFFQKYFVKGIVIGAVKG